MDARLNSLKKKHARLEAEISRMQLSPGADDLQITALKKQKLSVKEEIVRLEGVAVPA